MNHKYNNCYNCQNCKILSKKIELYENFINDMRKLDEELFNNGFNNEFNNKSLEESIIIEKDNHGNRNMKVRSDLSESFLVINNGKNLEELSKRDKSAIDEQDNLYNYNQAKEYVDKTNNVVSWGYYVIKWGKWLMFI